MNVVLVTMWGESYRGIAELTIPNMLEYCWKHGYAFSEIKALEGEPYYYKKHEWFRDIIEGGDVDLIFYCDCDTLITNHSIKVEDLIDEEHDLFITKDYTELNGGVIILKCNKGGKQLNDFILEERDNFENEQNIFNHYQEDLKPQMKILPQSTMNAYKYEIYPEIGKLTKEQGQWEPGCFLLHTPGASMQTRLETLKNTPIIK